MSLNVSASNRMLELVAYPIEPHLDMEIVPAPTTREWMNRAEFRHPYRCLPLGIANQAGWLILNSHPVDVTWNGDDSAQGLRVQHLDGEEPYPAVSHFGYGILTFHIPYLFRTPAGFDLLVRGPSNLPKEGISALEGIVETDWSVAAFLMNWQVTSRNCTVHFARGEPICMIVPQRRHELQEFAPRIGDLSTEPTLVNDYDRFRRSRDRVTADVRGSRAGPPKNWWQQYYARGRFPGGPIASDHQVRLRLEPFKVPDPPDTRMFAKTGERRSEGGEGVVE